MLKRNKNDFDSVDASYFNYLIRCSFFVVNVVVVVLALFQKANQFLHLNKIIIARRKAWLVLNQEHNVSRDALCQIPFKLAVY